MIFFGKNTDAMLDVSFSSSKSERESVFEKSAEARSDASKSGGGGCNRCFQKYKFN